MSRIMLFYILPFLLPFIGFFTYRFLVTRGQPLLQNTPWFVLSAMGLALVIASLVTLALTGGWDQEGDYVPPRLEEGRIVPGEVRQPGRAGPPAVADPTPELPAGDDGG
jgi:hypothetical protein